MRKRTASYQVQTKLAPAVRSAQSRRRQLQNKLNTQALKSLKTFTVRSTATFRKKSMKAFLLPLLPSDLAIKRRRIWLSQTPSLTTFSLLQSPARDRTKTPIQWLKMWPNQLLMRVSRRTPSWRIQSSVISMPATITRSTRQRRDLRHNRDTSMALSLNRWSIAQLRKSIPRTTSSHSSSTRRLREIIKISDTKMCYTR